MTAITGWEIQSLLAAYDFSQIKLLVDIGGGQGTLTAAVLKTHPACRAVLFDQPSVMEQARRYLQKAGVEGRCQLTAGCFFESVPAGGDTYLLKDILHDWEDESALAILKNCRAAMSDGARLLLVERVILPGDAPVMAKIADVTMMVITGGQERTDAEFRSLLRAADFKFNRLVPTVSGVSVVEAEPV